MKQKVDFSLNSLVLDVKLYKHELAFVITLNDGLFCVNLEENFVEKISDTKFFYYNIYQPMIIIQDHLVARVDNNIILVYDLDTHEVQERFELDLSAGEAQYIKKYKENSCLISCDKSVFLCDLKTIKKLNLELQSHASYVNYRNND